MKSREVPFLPKVASDRSHDIARKVKLDLFSACRDLVKDQGDDLAGYALVTWTQTGGVGTATFTEHGVVTEALMPAVVHDALNRMVSRHAPRILEGKS